MISYATYIYKRIFRIMQSHGYRPVSNATPGAAVPLSQGRARSWREAQSH